MSDLISFFLGYQKLFYQINSDLPEVVYVSLLFPARSLKTIRQFLDPHFSPTEVYEFVSVNLETISIRQGSGRVRLLIQPLVLYKMFHEGLF